MFFDHIRCKHYFIDINNELQENATTPHIKELYYTVQQVHISFIVFAKMLLRAMLLK